MYFSLNVCGIVTISIGFVLIAIRETKIATDTPSQKYNNVVRALRSDLKIVISILSILFASFGVMLAIIASDRLMLTKSSYINVGYSIITQLGALPMLWSLTLLSEQRSASKGNLISKIVPIVSMKSLNNSRSINSMTSPRELSSPRFKIVRSPRSMNANVNSLA